ncbi:hypothetical protein Avbf_05665 [Armadillidium vulgare]|nr:hypothetical protein Avbf_05665 [Armadillidium vulgare]
MQNLMYISNGVQLEIDRVIVVPLEILNRHCSGFKKKFPTGILGKSLLEIANFCILIYPHFHMEKDKDPVRIFQRAV